jgi:ABC-type uncharacterized transport system permease subunit
MYIYFVIVIFVMILDSDFFKQLEKTFKGSVLVLLLFYWHIWRELRFLKIPKLFSVM